MGCDISREKPSSVDDVDDLEAYLDDPQRAKMWEARLEFLNDPVCGGASCTMYKVKDKEQKSGDQNLYALKVMNAKSPNIQEMFKNEVNILRMLSKVAKERNLLEFVDAYRVEDRCYLITRFYNGGDLFTSVEAMGAQAYTEREAAGMLRDMFRSVLVCHEKLIAHRDIKPENFVFDKTAKPPSIFDIEPAPKLRLIDFGCSFKPSPVELPPAQIALLTKALSTERQPAIFRPPSSHTPRSLTPSNLVEVQEGTPTIGPMTPPPLMLQPSGELSIGAPDMPATPVTKLRPSRSTSRSSSLARQSSGHTPTVSFFSTPAAQGNRVHTNAGLDMQVPSDRPQSLYYVAPETLAADVLADPRYRWARCERCSELFYLKDLGKTLRSGERAEEKRGRTRPRGKSAAATLSPTASAALSPSPVMTPSMSPTSTAMLGSHPLLSTCCADGGSHVPDGHSRYRLRHKRLTAHQRAQMVAPTPLDSMTLPAASVGAVAAGARSLKAEVERNHPDASPSDIDLDVITAATPHSILPAPLMLPLEPLSLPSLAQTPRPAATPAPSLQSGEMTTTQLSSAYSFSPCLSCGSMVCYERNVPFQAYCRVTQGLHMLLCHHDYHQRNNPVAYNAVMSASAMAASQQHQQSQIQQAHTTLTSRVQTVPFARVPPTANRAALSSTYFQSYNADCLAYYIQQAQLQRQLARERLLQQQLAGAASTADEPIVLTPLPITNPAGLFAAVVRPVAKEGQTPGLGKPEPLLNERRSDPAVMRESGWRLCEECAVLYRSNEPHTHAEETLYSLSVSTPSRSRSRSMLENYTEDPLPPCCQPPANALDAAFRNRAQFDPSRAAVEEVNCSAFMCVENHRLQRHPADLPSDDEEDDEMNLHAYSMPHTLRPHDAATRNEISLTNLANLNPNEIPSSALAGWTLSSNAHAVGGLPMRAASRICALSFFTPDNAPQAKRSHRPLPICVSVDVGRVLTAQMWRAADIWALGVVMYVLLTGRAPFYHHEPAQLHALVSQCAWHMPTSISPEAQHLLAAILTRDPAQRPTAWQILHHPWLRPGAAPNAPLKHVAAALMSLRKDAQAGHAHLRRAIARSLLAKNLGDERAFAYLDSVLAHADHDGDFELSVDDVAAIVARLQYDSGRTDSDSSPLLAPQVTSSPGQSANDVLPTITPQHIVHAQDIMDQMQLTASGKLPLSELRVALAAATLGSSNAVLGPIDSVFDHLDRDKDGALSAQDLFSTCAPHITLAEAQDMVVVLADPNSYGRISRAGFRRAMVPSYRRKHHALMDRSPSADRAQERDLERGGDTTPPMVFAQSTSDDLTPVINVVSGNDTSNKSLKLAGAPRADAIEL